ncbi:ERAD-associated E3 ubiquitin-protein ligase doa10 [Grifola frondosa]|uniref:RING-type E3 ubiquitin transferase n=1 Tax=Grifola frondosa TaxID=5627 RepID=A0A1C7MAH3_GRIFR|nr:ERAD-associated E3 ubiquitin-protein ligase doa10 [Grifola frondosa]
MQPAAVAPPAQAVRAPLYRRLLSHTIAVLADLMLTTTTEHRSFLRRHDAIMTGGMIMMGVHVKRDGSGKIKGSTSNGRRLARPFPHMHTARANRSPEDSPPSSEDENSDRESGGARKRRAVSAYVPTTAPLNLDPQQTAFTFAMPLAQQVPPWGIAQATEMSSTQPIFTPRSPQFQNPVRSDLDLLATADQLAEEYLTKGAGTSPADWSSTPPELLAALPEPYKRPTRPVSPPYSTVDNENAEIKYISLATAPSSSTPGSPRRPPLPIVTLPPSPFVFGAGPSASASRSHGHTPLASPSLATYRAPEELEAGPSNLSGYFDDDGPTVVELNRDEVEAEHRVYFREGEVEYEDEDDVDMADAEDEDDAEGVRWTDEDYQDEDEGEGDGEPLAFQLAEDGRAGDPVAPGLVQQRAEIQVVQGQPVDAGEDLDANIEDDVDGALEAIGLRGPIYGVLQNAALMIFILDTTIGLGVFLPFTIGKSTALLCLNPRRFIQILHMPLRAIRLITDPVVDVVLFLVSRLSCWRIGRVVQGNIYISLGCCDSIMERVVASTSAPEISSPDTTPSFITRILESDSALVRWSEPFFARLGKHVRLWSAEAQSTWLRLAVGDGPNERVFAVLLGYAVIGIVLALYLNVLTVGSVRNAGRAVRNAIRQQLLVVKVAAFIIVELVIFPLGCGIMLDVCTVWLFPQGSFRSRAAFLMYAPLTAIFYHWVLGTMFMYQFAVLLAGCRGIMRSGAMWFIKDPHDQNFILSEIFWSDQHYCSRTIMPFRWKVREPLSQVPIDLLFLHLALPYTLHYFRPKKALRQFGVWIWKFLASRLRLTSYMFGERRPEEEYSPKHWSWSALLFRQGIEMDDAEAVHDGTFRRVPNSDNIALVKDLPATAEVDGEGRPINDNEAKLIAAQNAEAERAKRIIKDDYVVVYMPPHLKYRVIIFLGCLWTVGSVLLATVLAAPILLGRGFFRLFVPYDVHDGYSFIAGFYLLWASWLVGFALDQMDKRRQRRGGDEPRAEFPLYLAKRSLLWIAKISYMMFFLGIVIPTLLALVLELYIVQPIKQTINPTMVPQIRIVDMWALGLLYTKIIIRSLRAQLPPHGMMLGVDHIIRNGWTHADPVKATKEVIAPLLVGLVGMILLPPAMVWSLCKLVTLPVDGSFLFLHVYPTIFTFAATTHGIIVLSKVIVTWSQSIRDKEFLVEMRLRNLEPEAEQQAKIEGEEDEYEE